MVPSGRGLDFVKQKTGGENFSFSFSPPPSRRLPCHIPHRGRLFFVPEVFGKTVISAVEKKLYTFLLFCVILWSDTLGRAFPGRLKMKILQAFFQNMAIRGRRFGRRLLCFVAAFLADF